MSVRLWTWRREIGYDRAVLRGVFPLFQQSNCFLYERTIVFPVTVITRYVSSCPRICSADARRDRKLCRYGSSSLVRLRQGHGRRPRDAGVFFRCGSFFNDTGGRFGIERRSRRNGQTRSGIEARLLLGTNRTRTSGTRPPGMAGVRESRLDSGRRKTARFERIPVAGSALESRIKFFVKQQLFVEQCSSAVVK